MAALGIPSSRALCVIDSDTRVQREQIEHGATILRMARSHIRFGHFEHFHYTKQPEMLRLLADYTVDRYIPEFNDRPERYAELLRHATVRTATMIAHWQAVGFAHGVLNTDNMSIIGETFDYGPFGFLDDFDPTFICNHSDERGRYSFERQPSIGLWNLNALAHALSDLIEDTDAIRAALLQYEPHLVQDFSRLMRAKLGLPGDEQEGDTALLSELLELLAHNHSDYTLFFRRLCDFDETAELSPLRDDFMDIARFDRWAGNYRERLLQNSSPRVQRQEAMRRANPKFILRNYLAQNAIALAEQGDYSEVRRLHEVLQHPYAEQPGNEAYAAPPPDWGKHLEVSCSS
jgi:serine/tyrosine/threonine adenylyltransferase